MPGRSQKEKSNIYITMKKTFNFVITIIVAFMLIDFVSMIAWAASGQRPVDDFYLGSVSTHIIRALVR